MTSVRAVTVMFAVAGNVLQSSKVISGQSIHNVCTLERERSSEGWCFVSLIYARKKQ